MRDEQKQNKPGIFFNQGGNECRVSVRASWETGLKIKMHYCDQFQVKVQLILNSTKYYMVPFDNVNLQTMKSVKVL